MALTLYFWSSYSEDRTKKEDGWDKTIQTPKKFLDIFIWNILNSQNESHKLTFSWKYNDLAAKCWYLFPLLTLAKHAEVTLIKASYLMGKEFRLRNW